MRMDRRAGLLYVGSGIDVTAIPISFTGSYTDEIVTMNDGNDYRLLTLTSSGDLTLDTAVTADIWLCGGGANGYDGRRGSGTAYDGAGGGGGYAEQMLSQNIRLLSVVIGAANTASGTSVSGDVSLSAAGANSINGGSGGGIGGISASSAGTGDGLQNKRPFSDTFFPLHCSGGGGGGYHYTLRYDGGNGGENGSDGGARVSGSSAGGTGGSGAGDGGNSGENNGKNATEYGCGGGGGGYSYAGRGEGGAGKQGVCYIRIPLIQ